MSKKSKTPRSNSNSKKVYLSGDKNFKKMHDVWDLPRKKVVIYGNANPKWASLFYIGFDDPKMRTLVVEVYAKNKMIGEARLSLEKIPKENLVDKWLDLKAPSGKKGGVGGGASGRIHFRLVFSVQPETRPNKISEGISQEYFYKKRDIQFRAGDMLAYSGVGLLATVTKLVNNSEHSHIGLVLELPNKWHGDNELYILEMSSNVDKFIDPFSESARAGMVLFHLKERLHQFHGGLITHYPLKNALAEIPRDDLGDASKRVHKTKDLPRPPTGPTIQWISKAFGIDLKKNAIEFVPLSAPRFIAQALSHISVLKEDSLPPPNKLDLEWIKRQDIWGAPNLVRMPSDSMKAALNTLRGNKGGAIKKAPPQQQASPPPQPQQAPPARASPAAQQQMPMQGMPMQGGMMAMPNGMMPMQGMPMMPMQGMPQMPMQGMPQMPMQPPQQQFQAAPPPQQQFQAPPQQQMDPQLAAMEAEMKRLEAEAAAQQKMMDQQQAQLEAEQAALEQAMRESEAQMAQLQAGGPPGVFDDNSTEEDTGAPDMDANMMALQSAGLDFGAMAQFQMMPPPGGMPPPF